MPLKTDFNLRITRGLIQIKRLRMGKHVYPKYDQFECTIWSKIIYLKTQIFKITLKNGLKGDKKIQRSNTGIT